MARIQNGESLAQLAAEWSICPSKARGGDLGWVTEGQTVVEFEKAAFGASVNACTMVNTQFGVHVLIVTDERYLTAVQRISADEASEVVARARVENGEFLGFRVLDIYMFLFGTLRSYTVLLIIALWVQITIHS
jgi:parvulin-like peptidyl-prolyl isomerase